MKKLILITAVFCCTLFQSLAQDKNILFSQYRFNGLTVNPAYAGSHDVFSASVLSRYHMIGFEGAPTTYALNLHGPGKNTKTGWGANMMYETIGINKTVGFFANYAYRLSLRYGTLSMGLKAGVASRNQEVINPEDPAFNENASNYLLPNFGIGFYYKTRRIFAGLSVPLILGYKTNDDGSVRMYNSMYTYYLTAGIHLSPGIDWLITPSLLAQYESAAANLVIEGTVNILYKEVFGAGIAYRNYSQGSGAIIMLLNYRIGFQTTVGIAYDFGFGGWYQYAPYNRNSVEIALQLDLGFKINRSNPIIF